MAEIKKSGKPKKPKKKPRKSNKVKSDPTKPIKKSLKAKKDTRPSKKSEKPSRKPKENITRVYNAPNQYRVIVTSKRKITMAVSSIKNIRPYMEDTNLISISKNKFIFGVFDGHGGQSVSQALCKAIAPVITNALEGIGDRPHVSKIKEKITHAIISLDNNLYNKNMRSGSTAVIGVLINGVLITINLGDSRLIMFAPNKRLVTVTKDHKPFDKVERKRIKAKGGFVSLDAGDVSRVNGQLAVSRGFGDFDLKKRVGPNGHQVYSSNHLVSAIPDIKTFRVPKEAYIVLASDGLWDTVTNAQVARHVTTRAAKGVTLNKISSELNSIAKKNGSTDNITSMVLHIKEV